MKNCRRLRDLFSFPGFAPRAIGIDEIAVHKGHEYRAVVSDLDQGCPIWSGGEGRSEADIGQCFTFLGVKQAKLKPELFHAATQDERSTMASARVSTKA